MLLLDVIIVRIGLAVIRIKCSTGQETFFEKQIQICKQILREREGEGEGEREKERNRWKLIN